MDDLSALANALKGAATAKDTDDGSFIMLVEKYLGSNDPAVQESVVDTLAEIVGGLDEESTQSLLADSALGILPRLIILSPDCPYAGKVITSVVAHSRPKEVVLALGEAMSSILDELLKSEGLSENEFEDDEGMSEEDLVAQLLVVVQAYSSVIPRLNLTRSTPTLMALTDSIQSVLPALTSQLDIAAARALLSSLLDLTSAAWTWVETTSDKGGEQRAMLSNLLHVTVTLLSPRIEAKLAERWFVESFPKYKGLHRDDGEWKVAQQLLDKANAIVDELKITAADLTDSIIHPSSISPAASLSSLTLLTASLPQLSGVASTGTTTPPDIADCTPILTAALSSSAIDAGLAYLWSLLHQDMGVTIEYDTASMYLELLTPLAALPPTPTARTLLLKLISTVITSTPSPKDKLLLYKQLLEPENPFEPIRVEAISLLRDAITSPSPNARNTPNPSNPLLIPDLLSHLSPILFTLPSASSRPLPNLPSLPSLSPRSSQAPSPAPLDLAAKEIVQTMYPSWFTDCLNLLRLLVTLDVSNTTGVRDKAWLEGVRNGWVEPQRVRLGVMQGEKRDDSIEEGFDFVLIRWLDAVERVEGVIAGVIAGEGKEV